MSVCVCVQPVRYVCGSGTTTRQVRNVYELLRNRTPDSLTGLFRTSCFLAPLLLPFSLYAFLPTHPHSRFTLQYSPSKTDPDCSGLNCAFDEGEWFIVIVPDHLFTEIITKMRFDPLVFLAQIGGILGIIMGCLKAIKNTTLAFGKRRCIWCCHDRQARRQEAVLNALRHASPVGLQSENKTD